MAGTTLTRVDVAALATRLERQSIAINIPARMAQDMRLAYLILRHGLKTNAFDTFQIEGYAEEPSKAKAKQ
jgi:hypothetical protein